MQIHYTFFLYITEDNNTRVLFERVLTSGQLKNEDTVGLWNRFLEFECNVGDLASIVKVEKRRAQVLQKVQLIFTTSIFFFSFFSLSLFFFLASSPFIFFV